MVEQQENEVQGQESWSSLCLWHSYCSYLPIHQLLYLSKGMTLSAKGITVSIWGKYQSREHRMSQVHANGFPVTVMPLILELEHTRVMMLKFGRLIMGLQQSPYSSWHESHTIACFVTFILRAHEPIFHQFLKIWLGGIIISGHLVML